MKKIYIVSTYTGTVLAHLIRTITRKPYSHISISLDDSLETMYAFGRINPKNPLVAGFVEEGIDKGLYEIKKNTICRVYSLEIDDDKYEKLRTNINQIKSVKSLYSYDLISLIAIPLGLGRKPEFGYVCSTFAADMLSKSGIKLLNKPFYTVQPNDFYNLKGLTLEYEGLLREYNKFRATYSIDTI